MHSKKNIKYIHIHIYLYIEREIFIEKRLERKYTKVLIGERIIEKFCLLLSTSAFLSFLCYHCPRLDSFGKQFLKERFFTFLVTTSTGTSLQNQHYNE